MRDVLEGGQGQEVARDGQAEDAAHGQQGAHLGVVALERGRQVLDALLEKGAHGRLGLGRGQHGGDECAGLGRESLHPHVEDSGQVFRRAALVAGGQLRRDREEVGLRAVVLHHQGRVHPGTVGDRPDRRAAVSVQGELLPGCGEDALGGLGALLIARGGSHDVHYTTVEQSATLGSTDVERTRGAP
nr:hypothetical protein [Promicromonospora citrea]